MMTIPGHAAIDGKVDRVGEADEGVDDQHDVLRHLVVQEGVETENWQNWYGSRIEQKLL